MAGAKGPIGRLNNRVVLVTGAAGTIGAAVVKAIRRAGGRAVATDIAARSGIDHRLDVTSEADWRRVVKAITDKPGRLDGLVNAAGIVAVGTVEDLDFKIWRRVLSVNLDGAFLGCKYTFPLLRARGGSIVNLSSVSGLIGGHNLAAYNASKGGLSLLTKSVALHGARLKPPVRCNAVCPAFVEGQMIERIARSTKNPTAVLQKMAMDIPLGRLGQPAEIAGLCVYLLSDAAAFVTGADFPIDGGLTSR